MTAPSKSVSTARARLAGLTRHRSAGDPKVADAARELKALTLEEHIQKTVSAWPELTNDQMARLSGLFRTAGSHG